jgi:superfamily II DNA/RNA helicase
MSQRTVNPRRPSHAPPGPRLTALEPITSDAPLTGFAEFGVSKPVVDALKMRGISGAFAIQELVLRDAIAGRDVLARSRTGSGKTLAFAVPIVERLTPSNDSPTALILAPTRELASQVTEEFRAIADVRRLHVAAVYGGVAIGPQAKRARRAKAREWPRVRRPRRRGKNASRP